MADFYVIATSIGEAKMANALALGIPLAITELALGDGEGDGARGTPVPNPEGTALVSERRRAPVNSFSVDPDNVNVLIAEQVIPETAGGWWIREMGLFDEDGDMIFVCNTPPTYKPQLSEGSGRTQVVRMASIVSDTAAVTLKVDPSVVLATREYTQDLLAIHAEEFEKKISDRAIYVDSVAEIEVLPNSFAGQEALVSGAPFKFDGESWVPSSDYVTVEAYAISGVTDYTSAINDAIQSGATKVIASAPSYRIDGAIAPADGVEFLGGNGKVELLQYGSKLVEQTTDSLHGFVMDGFKLTYAKTTASSRDGAFSLSAHKSCRFSNFEFSGYGSQTILERIIQPGSLHNMIDNVYRDWYIDECNHVDISIGLEGYYHRFEGDGTATAIATGIGWPEQLPSSVLVVREAESRVFTNINLNTDYTVAYDGSGNLTVNMVTAPAVGEVIHIWPAQPNTGGDPRRTISNNEFRNIRCNAVYRSGHTAIRWNDAETYRFERLILDQDNAVAYKFNANDDRGGQAGDYAQWDGCVLSYRDGVVDPETLTAIFLGPGSKYCYGSGIRMDKSWLVGGPGGTELHTVTARDRREVFLAGTVDITIGSPTVTGTGTKFTEELTLVGDVKDQMLILGTIYNIQSIDSDTQVTLASNALVTGTDPDVRRWNIENFVSYDLGFSADGSGQLSERSSQSARYTFNNAGIKSGTATIASGNTFVTINHGMRRAPEPHEIRITPTTNLNGRSFNVSNLTDDSFRISIDTSAGVDNVFGWAVQYEDF